MYVWERVGGTEAGSRGRPHGSGIWAETWRGTQETEKDTPQGREGQPTGCEGDSKEAVWFHSERHGSRGRELRLGVHGLLSCRRIWGFLPHAKKLQGAECKDSSMGAGPSKAFWPPMGQRWKQTSGRRRLLLHPGGTRVRPEGPALVALRRGGWFSQGQHCLNGPGQARWQPLA